MLFGNLKDGSLVKILDEARTDLLKDKYLVYALNKKRQDYYDHNLELVLTSTPRNSDFQESFPWFKTQLTSQFLQLPLFFIHKEYVNIISDSDFKGSLKAMGKTNPFVGI